LSRDCLLTGPEDQAGLDQPPDPDASWRRSSVEEVLLAEQARLERWRERTLAQLRRELGVDAWERVDVVRR
jgi:hypothetical protein